MAPVRWSANLSMLWRDRPFLDRFTVARDSGFDTVEFWWPRGERPEDVEAAVKRCDLRVAVLNMDAGDLEAGDRGFLNRPECHGDVLAAAEEAIALARAVGCPFINSPVGKDSGLDRERQADAVVDVLRRIADKTIPAGILVTLEPLNSFDHPSYLMCSTALAVEWIGRAGPGVGLLFDAYHMGGMGEDIVTAPALLKPAHIQIADWPGRHEPGSGTLPFADMFDALEAGAYTGHVGLEYAPIGTAEDSLAWLREYQRTVVTRVGDAVTP
ncbi:MAG TPA: TIM barrel protein [Thermomicrobiaceae bacterium]|nr:TIM barrel protein [Thermomicrobiaceae bacterium]